VWLLTGFWHGAEWTFMVWGLYFGVLLIIEKTFLLKILDKYKIIGHIYLLLISIFSFIIFDAATIGDAISHMGKMFGAGEIGLISTPTLYYLKSFGVVLLIAIIGATPLPKKLIKWINDKTFGAKILTILEPIALVLLLLVCTGYLVDGSFNPFLYFRF
jgi:alginate O-acetyltransferase complex protein AlgI